VNTLPHPVLSQTIILSAFCFIKARLYSYIIIPRGGRWNCLKRRLQMTEDFEIVANFVWVLLVAMPVNIYIDKHYMILE
jgi:hypothetical protein